MTGASATIQDAATISVAPILIDRIQAARMLAISPSTLDKLRNEGSFPDPVNFGEAVTSVRWRTAELQAWVDAGCPPVKEWRAKLKATTAKS